MDILAVFFLLYSGFAIVGIHMFGGLVRKDDSVIAACGGIPSTYYLINMNDLMSAFVTLFAFTVINNWFVMANQFVCVKDGNILYLWYFIIFYYMVALIAINVVVSFVLDIYDSVQSSERVNIELLDKIEE